MSQSNKKNREISNIVEHYKAAHRRQSRFQTQELEIKDIITQIDKEDFVKIFIETCAETNIQIRPEQFFLFSEGQNIDELEKYYNRQLFYFQLDFYKQNLSKFSMQSIIQTLASNDDEQFIEKLKNNVNKRQRDE